MVTMSTIQALQKRKLVNKMYVISYSIPMYVLQHTFTYTQKHTLVTISTTALHFFFLIIILNYIYASIRLQIVHCHYYFSLHYKLKLL